jgi:hypothetical protein
VPTGHGREARRGASTPARRPRQSANADVLRSSADAVEQSCGTRLGRGATCGRAEAWARLGRGVGSMAPLTKARRAA